MTPDQQEQEWIEARRAAKRRNRAENLEAYRAKGRERSRRFRARRSAGSSAGSPAVAAGSPAVGTGTERSPVACCPLSAAPSPGPQSSRCRTSREKR